MFAVASSREGTADHLSRGSLRRPSLTNGRGKQHELRPEELGKRPSLRRQSTGYIKVVRRYLCKEDMLKHNAACEAEGLPELKDMAEWEISPPTSPSAQGRHA